MADTKSSLAAVGFAIGTGMLAYAGVRLIVWRPAVDAGSATDAASIAGSASSRPTVGQAISLAVCGFLLFFFSCGGLLINFSPLITIAGLGLAVGGLFMGWGLVRFVMALGRAFSGRRSR